MRFLVHADVSPTIAQILETCPAAKGLYRFLGYKLVNSFSVHNTYTNKSWSVDHAVIAMRCALLNIFFPPHLMLYVK